MSVAKIKSKQNKGKQKSLPKLKAILANPNKIRCPVLDEEELEYLKVILTSAIKESNLDPKRFATDKGICLGLESSLRNINNKTSSCVFISLGIKPCHIIGLIARNAETKDETQPVYAQPKLENFTAEIFGVQALCMVFPKNLSAISDNVNSWVNERKKSGNIKNAVLSITKPFKKKSIKHKLEKSTEKILEEKLKSDKLVKDWSGDFISFGKCIHEKDNSTLEDKEAVDALSEIMEKIPKSTTIITKLEHKATELNKTKENLYTASNFNITETQDSDYCDYFLDQYKTLTVNKIIGNPNKNPKKKRKKNKQTNTAK